MTPSRNYLLYDGECPMCARYVQMMRLRESLPGFELIDARSAPDLVAEHRQGGREINDGMVLSVNGALYHGSAALSAMAGLTTPLSSLNKLNAKLFASPARARLLYPAMVAGRNLLLRVLGNKQIA